MKIKELLTALGPRARKAMVGGLVFVLVLLLYPFQTTTVPAWNLRVVDDAGAAVSGVNVTEHWQHNLLELDEQTARLQTDADGRVSFPERNIRAGLFRRLVAMTTRLTNDGRRARLKPYAAVVVWGRSDHETDVAVYKNGEPPPTEIVLQRLP